MSGGGFDLLRMLGFANANGTSAPGSAFSATGSPWDPQGAGLAAAQRLSAPQGIRNRGAGGTGNGKASAEAYLGKSISGPEYDALIRATHAESGQRNSPEEQAMIMGSILNRARTNPGGIMGALNAPNQFQSVTGTKYQPGPSANYRNGPSPARQASIEAAASDLLSRVPQNQTDFTAASRSAYGAGTNPGYLDQMRKTGGAVYGGTQFATSLGQGGGGPSAPIAGNNFFANLFNAGGLLGQTDSSRSGRAG